MHYWLVNSKLPYYSTVSAVYILTNYPGLVAEMHHYPLMFISYTVHVIVSCCSYWQGCFADNICMDEFPHSETTRTYPMILGV